MWCGIRAPAPLVKGGGWGSPLRLLDRALPNTGRASCVHTHAHTHSHGRTTCSHTRHAGAYNPVPKPYVWFTRAHMHTLIHTHACTCLLAQCDSCVRTYLFSGARVYTCVHTYVFTYRHVCLHEHTNACIHVRTHVLAHTHTPGPPQHLRGWGQWTNRDLCPFPVFLPSLASCITQGSRTWTPSLLVQVPATLPFGHPSGWAARQGRGPLLSGTRWREACTAQDVHLGTQAGALGPGTGGRV